MKKKIKDYFITDFKNIKSNPKNIIKKWWFWLIIISCIFGIIHDSSQPTNTSSINSTTNTFIENNVVEESSKEKDIHEENEKKDDEEKNRQKNIEDTKWTLYATTEQIIKNRLKSPSTAKFSNQQAVFDESSQIYKIQGDVDSQNSFGATLRSTFYAEYNSKLEIQYLTFDGEVWLDNR